VWPLSEQEGEIFELMKMGEHTTAVPCYHPETAIKTATRPSLPVRMRNRVSVSSSGRARTSKLVRTAQGGREEMMVGGED
jgi:hypothetical protein